MVVNLKLVGVLEGQWVGCLGVGHSESSPENKMPGLILHSIRLSKDREVIHKLALALIRFVRQGKVKSKFQQQLVHSIGSYENILIESLEQLEQQFKEKLELGRELSQTYRRFQQFFSNFNL